jgi:prevent-host-death family protein
MKKTITATEAVRKFSEMLNSVRYAGEQYIIVRGGKPIAFLSSAESASKQKTLRDLKNLFEQLPKLADESKKFEMDLKNIIHQQPRIPRKSLWG